MAQYVNLLARARMLLRVRPSTLDGECKLLAAEHRLLVHPDGGPCPNGCYRIANWKALRAWKQAEEELRRQEELGDDNDDTRDE